MREGGAMTVDAAEGAMATPATTERARTGEGARIARWAWIAVAFALWIEIGVALVSRALNLGLATDVGLSPYHVVGYAALLALVAFCIGRVVVATRSGDGWRAAFPAGYGVVGAGCLAAVGYVVADVAWREGIGIADGIEGSLAPSRLLLVVALGLVAVGPLRRAVVAGRAAVPGWAVAASAALTLAAVGMAAGVHPVVNPWLEEPPVVAADDTELWSMNADGTDQTRIVEATDGNPAYLGAWSPDGGRIVFTRFLDTRDPETHVVDLWVSNADGSDAHRLLDAPGWQWHPAWSPDGDWIAYTEESDGGPWAAGGPAALQPGFGPQGPVTPGSAERARPDAEIWRVRADGSGAPEPIIEGPGDDRAPVYSPDGARIVFDSTRDGNTDVYVANADGSDQRPLTDAPGEDWSPSWSPDGATILFASDRTGVSQLYVMDPDGGNVRQLTDDGSGNVWPSWSRDGERIAFTSWRTGEPEIWSIARDGSDPRNLSRSPGLDDAIWTGAWGPDDRIVFSRAAYPPDWTARLAREDLGAISALLTAVLVAGVAALLGVLRPPFGAFALLLGGSTAIIAIQVDAWRFIPGAVVAGLVVDALLVRASVPRRPSVAGAASASGLLLGIGLTVVATAALGWTWTLLLGVALAAGILGWVIGAVVWRLRAGPPGAPTDAGGG
jgi:Tol biopolymer transport system component